MSHPPFPPPAGWASPAPGAQPPTDWAPPAPGAQPPTDWAPPAPGANPYAGQHGDPYAGPPPPASRSGSSLAVWLAAGALVVALIALVVALLALFAPMGMNALGDAAGMSSSDGTVPGAVVGQQLSGDRIAYAAVDALLAGGAEVTPGAITCETLLRLDEGSTSDCHGTVDGDSGWTGTMEFSGAPGEFSLYED